MYEVQANDFTGYVLLMPKPEIIDEFQKQKETALKALGSRIDSIDKLLFISFIAKAIARKFNVSEKAAEIRLSKSLRS